MSEHHDEHISNQEKLNEIYHLMAENNEILRGMRRREHVANIFRFFYWLIILGALGGVYYYISPLFDWFSKNKESISQGMSQFDELKTQFQDKEAFAKMVEVLRQKQEE